MSRPAPNFRWAIVLVSAWMFANPPLARSQTVSTRPLSTLRTESTSLVALTHADVVTRPGTMIGDATVIVRDAIIEAVGESSMVEVPAGAEVIECTGKRIYAGFVDAWGEAEVPDPPRDSGAPHFNGNVISQRNAAAVAGKVNAAHEGLRSQGFAVRLIAPKGGIVQGTSCVVLAGDDSGPQLILRDRVWHHLQLTVPRGKSRDRDPTSPMGAVALARQVFYDADWYRDAGGAFHRSIIATRPERNDALEVIAGDASSMTWVIDAPDERMAERAIDFANEFSLSIVLKGSGREYRSLGAITKARVPILLPIDFPEPPNVLVEAVERPLTQAQLMHWKLCPENPARLARSGATFCLTTEGLDNGKQFWKKLRVAVDRGLSPDDALKAITTTPARLMGLESKCGQIAPGMLANLVVASGDLFADDAKVITTWVGGKRFDIEKPKPPQLDAARWKVSVRHDHAIVPLTLTIDPSGDISISPNKTSGKSKTTTKLDNVVRERFRTIGSAELAKIVPDSPVGQSRMTILVADSLRQLRVTWPDGTEFEAELQPLPPQAQNSESREPGSPLSASASEAGVEASSSPPSSTMALTPFGAYGLEQPVGPAQPTLFRSATVWTSGPGGRLDETDVLIADGIIQAIGKNLAVDDGTQIIDCLGKHLAPGIIDCHSHIATDGGVNEVGQTITSEVRIADFIDPSESAIYRQLAGGVTAVNILHGSANPIGGQNCVIKLRWGDAMDELVMREAPPGIKFALGENVKLSGGDSRYPGSRMGVEQIIRDQLMAARLYDAEHARFRRGEHHGLPPRKDLQLESLAEVLRGERWIHCHCYRQDEILTFLNVLEEFNVQVGTLQHVLEGYKIADELVEHRAMASSFADWWGYKPEVADAIPYNGAIMHRRGVVVSFNSDDRELGTHLNNEAAKAMKYGDVSEEDALKFVTIHPAMQLRIDQHTGSIEVGKDADVAVWSGPPLSTMSRCEQTWVDGRNFFSLESDAAMRKRDATIRAELIQEILAARSNAAKKSDNDETPKKKDNVAEEDRWLRYDAFCGCRFRLSDLMQSEGR